MPSVELGRKKVGLAVLVLYGVGLLLTNTGRKGTQPIGDFRSDPPQAGNWDAGFRFLTHPFLELFADGMIAHIWDFDEIPSKSEYQGTLLPGDPQAMIRRNPFDYVFADTRWGIQRARVIGVDHGTLKAQDKSPRFYQYAYVEPEKMQAFEEGDEKKLTRCKIIIPINEQVRILVGNGPFRVFLIDPDTDSELTARIFPDSNTDETIDKADPRFRWSTRLL